ncbi:rhodanese-like domain-containing protein [Streptomyces sp. CC208A]|uniref:rhodanese-like domain-containing protein n=1 Tax=Streptomyces sp. CC208A TaxID=3044573 RepID=UPI0024A7BECB|nr:rhodanese-like domain-containing protein [Streptomyces sp. CC208A]
MSGEEPAPASITAGQLKDLLDRGAEIDLIDVREPHEWEIVRIPGARLVPGRAWLDGTATRTLSADRTPVFYCRTGVRTRAVLAAVRQAGFADAVHLEGGVIAWVRQIDPSLPEY